MMPARELIDKIDNERKLKRRLNIDPASNRLPAGRAVIEPRLDAYSQPCGCRYRSRHLGRRGHDADARLVPRYHRHVDIVAFPQSGLLRRPGTLELMDEAMKAGSDVVGGLDPCAIDRDPKGHLRRRCSRCAQKYGKALDIHLHEPGEMGAFSIELIFERTRALGHEGSGVTVSHAFCLGSPDRDARRSADRSRLGELDIAHHDDGAGIARPAPPMQALLAARHPRLLGLGWHSRYLGPLRQCRHARTRDARGPAQQFPAR
jgi:cytosine/creatinine deaminase